MIKSYIFYLNGETIMLYTHSKGYRKLFNCLMFYY